MNDTTPSHSWDSSKRRPDPKGWSAIRKQVIARALGVCQHHPVPSNSAPHPQRCYLQGTDVDHIINLAQGGIEELDNLQLLCSWHHKQKTAKEAQANRVSKTERHPREKHPGLIDVTPPQ
jgi:5-methylcytosine-specific restriction protein A